MAIKQIKELNIEFRAIRHDNGEVIWIQAQAKLKFGEDGNPTHLIGTILDISDKKRDEETIEIQRERLALATNAARFGIWEGCEPPCTCEQFSCEYQALWRLLL